MSIYYILKSGSIHTNTDVHTHNPRALTCIDTLLHTAALPQNMVPTIIQQINQIHSTGWKYTQFSKHDKNHVLNDACYFDDEFFRFFYTIINFKYLYIILDTDSRRNLS